MYDGTLKELHGMAFAAVKGTNESYNFKQAMDQPDRSDFLHAMEKEISDHSKRKHWELMPRSHLPSDVKNIWSPGVVDGRVIPTGIVTKVSMNILCSGSR